MDISSPRISRSGRGCNPGRGIWNRAERFGKTGQGGESLISTFECVLNAAAEV